MPVRRDTSNAIRTHDMTEHMKLDSNKSSRAKRGSVGTKPKARKKARPRKRKSLAELNAWLAANHDALLGKAARNSIRLTGKPTFGGTRRACC